MGKGYRQQLPDRDPQETEEWIESIEDAVFNMEQNTESVILSAHSNSLHIWVISVMDILNKYGFDEVQIRTIEK